MFSCKACLRRALTNLAIDHPSATGTHGIESQLQASTPARISKHGTYISSRGHASYESLARGHHRRLLRKAIEEKQQGLPPPNARRKGPSAFTKGEVKDALARSRNRENQLIKNDDEDRQVQRKMQKEVEMYHNDPLQLANYVQKKLRAHDFGSALNLVRASDGIVAANIVSWNHLVDYSMSQGDTEKAWKVFNEMKKRGQRPDAHTYTIMLRGYGQNIKKSNVAERAVGIYNSMFAPNSKVTPNTIHTNAVLNVCARKRDMDSMWAIAGRLPVNGPGAPDRWTFTTILNAIREDAIAKVADLLRKPGTEEEGSLEQRQKVIFDEALRDGRKLWGDVSYRWRRADLAVDEQLVCAMGRLILGCGTRSDFLEVFDLVDQTMNMKLRKQRDRVYHKRDTSEGPSASKEKEATEDEVEQETQLVPSKPQNELPLDTSIIYAKPSNNTLSMIMEAAVGSKDMSAGKAYWDLLTDKHGPYGVQPDVENIVSYLRLLRISRSSVATLELLNQYWPNHVAKDLYRRGTFVIAMSTCVRDKNSPIVFETADKLLTLMQNKLEEAELGVYQQSEVERGLTYKETMKQRKIKINSIDETFGEEEGQAEIQRAKQGVESLNMDPKAMRMYIDLAILTTKGWNEGLKRKEDDTEEFERDSTRNHTLRALRRVGPHLINIRRLALLKIQEAEMEKSSHPKLKRHDRWDRVGMSDRLGTRVAEKLEDLIDLLRKLVSAYDKVIMVAERFEDKGLKRLDEAMLEKFRDNKRMVGGFLFRTKEEVSQLVSRNQGNAKWKGSVERGQREDVEDDEEWESRTSNDQDGGVEKGAMVDDERKITKDLKKIYQDTDRDLGRTESRSRRQRNERRKGVEQRIQRRLGPGQGQEDEMGMVSDDLSIEKRHIVEKRMTERAFGIKIPPKGGPGTSATRAKGRGNTDKDDGDKPFTPWGASTFAEMAIKEGQNPSATRDIYQGTGS